MKESDMKENLFDNEAILFLILYHIKMCHFLNIPLEKYLTEIHCKQYLTVFEEFEKVIAAYDLLQSDRAEEYLKKLIHSGVTIQ